MKTVNQVKNAYTYYLEDKMKQIYGMRKNDNVSLESMKGIIKSYIKDAKYSYKENGYTLLTKKQWFISTLNSLENKDSVYFFCRNSVRKAKETEANLNYKN